MSPRPRDTGQAAVELVALLPVLAVCALAVWQLAVAGHAVWAASSAARAASRAAAVGGSARATARRSLPAGLRRGLRVDTAADGRVRVRVAVPRVVGDGAVTTFVTSARFEPQR